MIGYSEIHSGKYRKVVSIEEDGENLCDQYLNSLNRVTRRKLMVIMKVVADELGYSNTQKFEKLKDDIWEFKSRTKTLNARVYCFFQANKIVCTHGTDKQKNRQLDTEIAKAIRIRRRFIDEGGIKNAIKD